MFKLVFVLTGLLSTEPVAEIVTEYQFNTMTGCLVSAYAQYNTPETEKSIILLSRKHLKPLKVVEYVCIKVEQ